MPTQALYGVSSATTCAGDFNSDPLRVTFSRLASLQSRQIAPDSVVEAPAP